MVSRIRIRSIRLANYKRFNDLTIADIPVNAKLVVLVGPNGSGKSSVFDGLLLKSWASRTNYMLNQGRDNYYLNTIDRSDIPSTTQEVANRITIQFHNQSEQQADLTNLFRIRTAYRNDPDFELNSLSRPPDPASHRRFERIIDADQSVAENYTRLAWQRMADLDQDADEFLTFGQYRSESLAPLQSAIANLFSNPQLRLQDFGGVSSAGTFRFAKGATPDFHYKNLSAGEKSAFDLLLDVFVSSAGNPNLIYCIDEPEAHLAPSLQRMLLRSLLEMIPDTSQLWIATHAAGFINEAKRSMLDQDNVAFLDFGNQDFDRPAIIRAQQPTRRFWQRTYQVALDDFAALVAPTNVVICEGDKSSASRSHDAACYNTVFEAQHPDVLFVSYGAASEVQKSESLSAIIVIRQHQ